MKKEKIKMYCLAIIILATIILSGCSFIYRSSPPPFGNPSMTFLPKQCELAPWEKWYNETKLILINKSSEKEVIIQYYIKIYNISLNFVDLDEQINVMIKCDKCSCPRDYKIKAGVKTNEDAKKLYQLGWIYDEYNPS